MVPLDAESYPMGKNIYMKSAQSSTQSFTEIQEVIDDVVVFKDNTACTILKLSSVNFALLATEEQDAKVFAYAALLNSLSFPIQILIRSRPIQIMPYLNSLDNLTQKTTNLNLKSYMEKYRNFVESLVKTTTVLDKQFYIIISYSSLESGAINLVKGKTSFSHDNFMQQAQASLKTKAESLLTQIHRLTLQANILRKEELIRLFYDIYNHGESFSLTVSDIENPMVRGAGA